jgi:hypothetical protein
MLGVVFATFSLHRELLDMILGDKPLLSQGGYITKTMISMMQHGMIKIWSLHNSN